MRFDVLESSLKITGLPIAGSRIPNNYTDGKNLKNKKNARWKQRRSVESSVYSLAWFVSVTC